MVQDIAESAGRAANQSLKSVDEAATEDEVAEAMYPRQAKLD